MLSENKLKECRLYSENRRQAARLYGSITKVLRAFDGKCYNVRLERALKEDLIGHFVYCDKRFGGWIAIVVSPDQCREWFDLAIINTDDLIDGKRIQAEKVIESARNIREKLLKEAAAMDRFVETYDTIYGQIESLKKAYNAVVDDLPYKGREILRVQHMY